MNTNIKCIDVNGNSNDIDIQHIQAITYKDGSITIYCNGNGNARCYLVDNEADRVMSLLKPEWIDTLKAKKQIGSARVDSPVDFFNDDFLSSPMAEETSPMEETSALEELASLETEGGGQSRYSEEECIREVVEDFEMAMPYMLGEFTDEDAINAATNLLYACRCAVVNEYVKVDNIDKFEKDLDTYGAPILFSNTCDNIYTRVFNDVYEMTCDSSYEINGLDRIKYNFHKLYLRLLQYGVTHGLANDMDLQSV